MQVGDRVQRFEVVGHLGTGGMGTVFRARDPQLERDVAIKLMAQATGMPALLTENETVDLRTDAPASADDLLREARMMARLSHPNVLPVYEVGLINGSVFVVMEHIDGCDLRDWLSRPRANAEIIEVFEQAARGLAAAHECGIVHRDFKPENVLVGSDGRVRVADFGLSRLVVRPHHAMRRLDDNAQGTPRYMAPELWRGDPAAPQSDIYAFCVALAEAFGAERDARLYDKLREREVPPMLRDLIVAGVAENPNVRPTLSLLIGALGGKSRIATGWLVAGALAAIGATCAVGFALVKDPGPSCAVPPPATWDAPRREVLRGMLAAHPRSAAAADTLLATLDANQRAIDDGWQATCHSLTSGALTRQQAAARQSCIERRQFELAARIDEFMRAPNADPIRLFDRARIADVTECASLVAPAMKADHDTVRALYQRFARAEESQFDRTRVNEFLAIATAASQLDERELEARATFNAGQWRADLDEVSDGDALMQKGYGIALELRAIDMQALMLIKRSRNAMRRADPRGALSLAKLALDLVENQATSLATRAKVYAMLSYAAAEQGDYQGALDKVTKGLEAIEKDQHRLPVVELQLLQSRVNALKYIEGRGDEALAAARANVEWARKHHGEHSEGYALTLNTLGFALLDRGDNLAALEYVTKAIAAAEAALPRDSAQLMTQRLDYASVLQANGKLEEARTVLTDVFAAVEHNEALRQQLPLATFQLGRTLCKLDRCGEGLAHLERAVELGTSQYGADHAYTQAYRYDLLTYQLELDRLDDAERTYAALERNYLAHAAETRSKLVMLEGIHGVELQLARGHARKGEELARASIAKWQELKGDNAVLSGCYGTLGVSLIDQKRWPEARAALDQAVTLASGNHGVGEDFVAELQTQIARVEAAQGNTQAARERAKKAQAVLARYPMSKHARAQLAALLR